jgi:hypothetical protein
MTKVVFSVALAVLVLLVGGCPNPGTGTDQVSSKSGGSLKLNLPAIPLQLAKQPDTTVPAFYDVSGSGPGNASFVRSGITGTSVTVDSLAPGDWGVTVIGNNLNGVQVESASLLVTVVEGETSSQDVVVSKVVGEGTLDVFLEWPESRAITLANVTLTPQGGAPVVVTLPPGNHANGLVSVSATAAAPAGYYTLSRVFSDGNGGADAVQVTSGATTTFALSVVSGINVAITPDISKVIPITFDGYKSTIAKGTSMVLTAKPESSKAFNSFTFQWYLDGVALANQTDTVTIVAAEHPGGSHRLDIVIASHGVLSSDSVLLTIAGQ